MTSDEIRKLLKATPFVPFRIYMGNERAFEVRHPEFVLVHPNGRTALVAPPGEGGVDILMIKSIKTMPRKRQTKNGRRGKTQYLSRSLSDDPSGFFAHLIKFFATLLARIDR